MRDVAILFFHMMVTMVRLTKPGGLRAVVAESVLVRHQISDGVPLVNVSFDAQFKGSEDLLRRAIGPLGDPVEIAHSLATF